MTGRPSTAFKKSDGWYFDAAAAVSCAAIDAMGRRGVEAAREEARPARSSGKTMALRPVSYTHLTLPTKA